jgi:hypothetical protein
MRCGCQDGIDCGCHGYGLALYRGLGALTPDQAAQQAMPKGTISSKAGFTQQVYDDIVQAAQSGQFAAFNPSGCTGVSAGGNLKLAQTATGLALTGASAGAAIAGALTVVAPFLAPITAIVGLFGMIFSHHAQAVALEQRTVCAAVPAANNYLQVIEQAVQSGAATPQQGIQALQSLLSDFTSQVSGIMKNNSSQCNAACVWVKELTAIVAEVSSQYQDAINPPATPSTVAQPPSASTPVQVVTPSRPNTVAMPGAVTPTTPAQSSYTSFYSSTPAPAASPFSSNELLPIAALAIAAFFFVRSV